jgi:hypothetical protein
MKSLWKFSLSLSILATFLSKTLESPDKYDNVEGLSLPRFSHMKHK